MPELLLEVGCEELPATFVEKAVKDLSESLSTSIKAAFPHLNNLKADICFGTPRRLIVSFQNIPERQEDSVKEMRGPALKAAYDSDQNPLPPLVGFCKSNGVDVSTAEIREGYVWVRKSVIGLPTIEILQTLLPTAITGLSFEKSMRWGRSRLRFARPIRWIVALFDEKVVPFKIENVVSGSTSRGHRFYDPDPFEVTNSDSLIKGLRDRKVEPDAEKRKFLIVDQIQKVAAGFPDLPAELVAENVYLTEWPTAITGTFKEDHLELPSAVLTTAMAKHERMFPVRNSDGKLENRYVFIRNSGVDEDVRRGTQWVLNARLDDAQFFFREDKKSTLSDFLNKTVGIVFQAKLGTVRDRSERLHDLCTLIAERNDSSPQTADNAARAGLYSKADLSSGLVSEFASLQGVIGGEYARREGFAEPICHAIATQYQPSANMPPKTEGDQIGLFLSMADALDKLAGYLGIGLVPSGSSDPYGLRRAATVLIESAWSWPKEMPPLTEFFSRAVLMFQHQGYPLDPAAALSGFQQVMRSRYESLLEGTRYDIIDAALQTSFLFQPRQVRRCVRTLEILSKDTAFVQTATRPLNLVTAAEKKGISCALKDYQNYLESEEGTSLFLCLDVVKDSALVAAQQENPAKVASALKDLQDPINSFIDQTMIMVENEKVRSARLNLMAECATVLAVAGDFSRLVQQ